MENAANKAGHEDINPEDPAEIVEEDDEETIKQKWTPLLVTSCQKGDLENAKLAIEHHANVLVEDKKKWTPLMWAACKGHYDIVKLLLRHGAAMPYLQKKRGSQPNAEDLQHAVSTLMQESTLPNPNKDQQAGMTVKVGHVNYEARYSPVMWSTFKGHLNILWVFLKEGLDLYETDVLGNNSIHQAVAGGWTNAFSCLLEYGVSIAHRNARDHGVEELATNKEIVDLIAQYNSAKSCPICNKQFPGIPPNQQGPPPKEQLKYLCNICKRFFCHEDRIFLWLYETHQSMEQEMPESRCTTCHQEVLAVEEELKQHMSNYDLKKLAELLEKIRTQKIHVEVKLFHSATRLKDKLTVQENLKNLIHSLQHVDDYKTIKKAINTLQDIVKDARKDDITLDQDIIELLDKEMSRLQAERDLRFEIDNLQINEAKVEEVKLLEELIQIAKDRKVEMTYIGYAEILKEKMSKNIEAKKIYKLFAEYPLREYPEVLPIDPKTKKPIDPTTGKPMDAKRFAEYTKQQELQKKKQKKMKNKFIIPEWAAASIESLEKSIKGVEQLMAQKELEFDEQFFKDIAPHLGRMKKEVKFRKIQEEEEKAAKEKSKKKK